ncbi:hypothetical protein FRC07_002156 [Ceratobasidium sp. 392]|nr:hypothetical protein FRC07_002156 [Ceratobasidium sp. 392]
MSTRRTNALLLCSVIATLNNLAISRQTTSSYEFTTSASSESAQYKPSPTPTTPIVTRKYSRNDPFRIFAPPSDPVCCLIPLPSAEPDPHPADDLLSFEEWKQRQLALTSSEEQRHTDTGAATAVPSATASDEHVSVPETTNNILVPVIDTSDKPAVRPVGDFVPIRGRYNYASSECSARVHGTHKSMKSAGSILSSKKDRYMLAPCSVDKKYVVVELCDEIRVDTVQLANFEFFSGVFKDITITLSRTANVNDLHSEVIGVYEAKNVRSVQTFRPFNRPHAFYRFIRIDFHTHYGKEYFCPVSLLRVYGLTQMEEWRMEEWEREWQARTGSLTISSEPAYVPPLSGLAAEEAAQAEAEGSDQVQVQEPLSQPTSSSAPTASSASTAAPSVTGLTEQPEPNDVKAQGGLTSGNDVSDSPSNPGVAHVSNSTHHSPSSSSNVTEFQRPLTTDTPSKVSSVKGAKTKISASASAGTPVLKPTHVPSPSPSNSGGESIYRTIMNRLDVLERNSTLSLRYVEEQSYSVRQALRRLEEDVGRLKALTGRQQQEIQRSMKNVERKQAEMEKRWDALFDQVNTLAEEVVLEKRLGIAQLCLLTTVLVFMALTRGSRTEPHLLGGIRRRVDSGLGIARNLHPRNRAQSRPRASERPFAWARQDRHSTGDISHHDSGEPPLTPVRSRSPVRTVGTPPGSRGRKISSTEARSPSGQSSRGVRFPQGLNPFPSSRAGNPSTGMRRSQSLSLSTDQPVPSPGMGKRPATGMKRLARTAHLHEVEVEAQRRRRIQAEPTDSDNDSSNQKSQPVSNSLALSVNHDLPPSDGHPASDNPLQDDPSTAHRDSLDTEIFGQRQPLQQSEKGDGTDWEDTDAEAEDSGQELVVIEDIPAPRVPRLFSPPTPGTWGARRKGRGFSVDTGTALRLQCA